MFSKKTSLQNNIAASALAVFMAVAPQNASAEIVKDEDSNSAYDLMLRYPYEEVVRLFNTTEKECTANEPKTYEDLDACLESLSQWSGRIRMGYNITNTYATKFENMDDAALKDLYEYARKTVATICHPIHEKENLFFDPFMAHENRQDPLPPGTLNDFARALMLRADCYSQLARIFGSSQSPHALSYVGGEYLYAGHFILELSRQFSQRYLSQPAQEAKQAPAPAPQP